MKVAIFFFTELAQQMKEVGLRRFILSHPQVSLEVYLTWRPSWGMRWLDHWGWGRTVERWPPRFDRGCVWAAASCAPSMKRGPVGSRACSLVTCHTHGGGSPNPCAGRRIRSTVPHYNHCMSHWPSYHSSSNSVNQSVISTSNKGTTQWPEQWLNNAE